MKKVLHFVLWPVIFSLICMFVFLSIIGILLLFIFIIFFFLKVLISPELGDEFMIIVNQLKNEVPSMQIIGWMSVIISFFIIKYKEKILKILQKFLYDIVTYS